MGLNLPSFLRRCLDSLCQPVMRRLRRSTKPDNHSLALNAVLDATRSKAELVFENALLRQQLIVLQRQGKRPLLTWRDRGLFVLIASRLPGWKTVLLIVQPDTLLRWHREVFRRVWRRKSRHQREKGRPRLAEDVVALIKNMAQDNRTWGAERIRGELLKLGLQVAKSTIQKYIHQVRSAAPTKRTWARFLSNHAQDIWAVDFLQTYDLFFRAIFVFVVIELGSRRPVHFGVTRSPNDAWVAQQLREAASFGEGPRFLIRDNDNRFGAAFDRVAEGTDIELLPTPCQAPKANAVCERFLGSVRRECLDFFAILSERHLQQTLKQYQAYFNHARPHQGMEQRIPCSPKQAQEQQNRGKIIAQPVLGGLHHDYRRRTAGGSSFPRAA